MKLSIQSDFKKITKTLNELQKTQVPFATAKALNELGQQTKEFQRELLKREIDNPTRFTVNSVFSSFTNKRAVQSGKAFVEVGLKDKSSNGGGTAARYLQPLLRGGKRETKRFEYQIRRKVKDKKYIALTDANRRNRFGNVGRARINNIIKGINDPEGKFELVANTGLIYEKKKRSRKVVGVLTNAPRYTKQFDLVKSSIKFADRKFIPVFEKQLRLAVMNAKRKARA